MSAILNETNSVEQLKVPPHSIEAEQSVLGGLLLENSALKTETNWKMQAV